MTDSLSAYAGLARLLDAVLDDGQTDETTTNVFLEEALRRFATVRTDLTDSGSVTSSPQPVQQNIGLVSFNRDGTLSAATHEALEHSGWVAIPPGAGKSTPIYTTRGHYHLDHFDLENQYFEVIEAARSNGHTTPDFNTGQGLLKMIAAQAHTSGIFTAEAAACTELAKNRRHAGFFGAAERYARNALKISQERGFRRTTILAYLQLGMLFCNESNLDLATALVDQTDIDLRARLAYAYARSAKSQGHLVKAIELLVRSEIMYEAAGDSFGLARAKARLGSYLRLLGDFKAAVHHLEEALTLARRGSFKRVEGYVLLDLGDIRRVTSQDHAAGSLLRSAEQLFSVMGHIGGRARALVGLALLELRHANSAAGVPYAEEACSLYKKVDRVMGRGVSAPTALALRCLGECLSEMNVLEEDEASRTARYEKAGRYLDEAILAYHSLDNRDGEALSLVGRAKLLARSTSPESALPLANKALDILAEMPGRFWQGTDTTLTEGFHSWCYRDTIKIAIDCNDYHVARKALLASEHDKALRELRALLVRQGGELGDTVRKLTLVELMMHPPAHDPDLGVYPPHRSRPVGHETRNRLLARIEELDPDIAHRIRND